MRRNIQLPLESQSICCWRRFLLSALAGHRSAGFLSGEHASEQQHLTSTGASNIRTGRDTLRAASCDCAPNRIDCAQASRIVRPGEANWTLFGWRRI